MALNSVYTFTPRFAKFFYCQTRAHSGQFATKQV